MGSIGPEVLWSPVHPNKFITWGTDIHLYEIGPGTGGPNVKKPAPALLATNSSHRYVKCVDICHRKDADVLLAVGQANGKVVLASFGSSNVVDAVGREFAPVHPRQCNALAWNPVDSNLIAVGLEKFRAEPAVSLWDALRCPHHFGEEFQRENAKAVVEVGFSEAANSLAWINSFCFAVGLNNKNVKIVDRRDSSKVVNNAATKAVHGIAVESHNEQILASFFENQICIWDVRNFERPISTVTRSRAVSKVSWCPTRLNLLASLQRDSNVIVLHDMQMATVGNEEVEPTLLERSVHVSPGNSVTSFSWHPFTETRLLMISLSGALTDYFVAERITLNWSPSSHLVWTHGRKSLKVVSETDSIYAGFDDISVKMKKRALRRYGLKPELRQNGELADDESLRNLWYWLYASRSLVESGTVKSATNYHPGVVSVLNLDTLKSRSELVSWPDLNNPVYVKVYKSEEREAALELCGWKHERESSGLVEFLEKVRKSGAYSRAAAMAVFHLKLRLAINILTMEAENQTEASAVSVIAMALSGFSDERSSIWRELCVLSRSGLADPYIRAIFAFLTAENENYDNVLNEAGMTVADRTAFACVFLNDARLAEYLAKLSETLTEEGDLSGMLLTGATADGAKLLQRYLDATGDVQSVSLLAVRAFPLEVQAEPSVQSWITSYQQILDRKRLWNQRAHFDLALNTANQCEKLPQQVFVSCNFCGKSISAYVQGGTRARSHYQRLGPGNNKLKTASCPNCRKPLPRCAVCLAHMGTPLSGDGRSLDKKLSELSAWFTWCQTCRHGGHAGHVSHWFEKHAECPVTGCSCKCFSLDPGGAGLSS